MFGVRDGQFASMILYIAFMVIPLIFIILAYRGKRFTLKKKIAAVDAIPEAIARTAELGGVCIGSSGGSPTDSWRGPQVAAGLTLLGHVARLAVRNNVPFYIVAREPDQSFLAEDVLRTAYAAEGKPEQFKSEYNLWFGREPAFDIGTLGFMEKNKVGSSFWFGGFGGEGLLFSEFGARKGIMQIAGTPNTAGIVFLVCTCDYVMIGDELFAAAATISQDPVEAATLIGGDVGRGIVMAIVLVGVVLASAGSTLLTQLLKI